METKTCPREILRHKLACLGIPREAHELEMLARLLPVRLGGMRLDGLDPDALAEALIYLIDRGIIGLPCQIEGLIDFDWGSHACHFYRARSDLLELLTAYFEQGLGSGEYCMWVAPDAASVQALRAALAASVPRFDVHACAMECLDHAQWYLDEIGELKPAGIVIDNWARKAQEAVRAGFRGLRCAAQMPRIDRKNWNRVVEYEREIDAAAPGLGIKVVCAYPLLEYGARDLAGVRESHDRVLVKGEGWWHRVSAPDAAEADAVLMALQEGRP